MDDFEFKGSISLLENEIIIRPINKKEDLKKIFYSLKAKGSNIISFLIEGGNNEFKKSRDQEKMYRNSLKFLVPLISDVDHRYTPDKIHREVKKRFCEFKLDQGVDLYQYVYEKENGETIKIREPISFDYKINGKLYSEYIQYFKEYCISEWNIDPFEDIKERNYISKKL